MIRDGEEMVELKLRVGRSSLISSLLTMKGKVKRSP